jgi:hypothetical protein
MSDLAELPTEEMPAADTVGPRPSIARGRRAAPTPQLRRRDHDPEGLRFEMLADAIQRHRLVSKRPSVPTTPADHQLYRRLEALLRPPG